MYDTTAEYQKYLKQVLAGFFSFTPTLTFLKFILKVVLVQEDINT